MTRSQSQLPIQTLSPARAVAGTTSLRMVSQRRLSLFALLIVLLVLLFVFSLSMGSVSIPLPEIVTILTGGEPARATWTDIVLKFRLPKALTALLAGSALAVAGLQMQTLFRNPLSDPYVLGISSGASLGVALVVLASGVVAGLGSGTKMLAGLSLAGDVSIALASIAGSLVVLLLVMAVARRVQSTMTLLILGLMFGYATSALVSVLLYFSIADRIQAYISWTFGSFGGVTWSQMKVMAPAISIGLLSAFLLMKPLNALLLGETYARSMGLNVRRVRLAVISSAAILAGIVTAFCGPIGFLGIAVPHFCRSLFATSDHRVLLPAVTLMGAILAIVADLVAGLPGSQLTLPLNAVTALIGAPVVTWVILRQRNLREAFAG
jgi:iron complex transport system permease protein